MVKLRGKLLMFNKIKTFTLLELKTLWKKEPTELNRTL